MKSSEVSPRIARLLRTAAPAERFITDSPWARRAGDPEICDFALGNPHELPLPAYVEALQRWLVPQNKDWFAYKLNEPEPRAVVAASLTASDGMIERALPKFAAAWSVAQAKNLKN